MKEFLVLILLTCRLQAATFTYNPEKLLFFHPEMLSWHFGLGTFFRKPVYSELEAQTRSELLKSELDQLDREQLQVEKKARDAFQESLQEAARIEGNAKRLAEIKNSFRESFGKLQADYESSRKALLLKHFLSREEALVKLDSLREEIRTLARGVLGKGDALLEEKQKIHWVEGDFFEESRHFQRLTGTYHPVRSALYQDFQRVERMGVQHGSISPELRFDQAYEESLLDFTLQRFEPVDLPGIVALEPMSLEEDLMMRLADFYHMSQHQKDLLLRFIALEI